MHDYAPNALRMGHAVLDQRERVAVPLRVLVIEDHAESADTMALLIGDLGHEVAVARDSDSGLAKARELRPDLVFCDIGLPGSLDGYDVARALRADARTRSIKLVALTGYTQDEDRERALDAGFDVHDIKPIGSDRLREIIASMTSAGAID